MEKIKVLYIDDEIENLNAFKASFRRKFDIYTANTAEEGLSILEQNPIEIIIADQKMPGKTGVDFFESILDDHPEPKRILLTAFSDINAVIDAINKGQVYRYVTKPWDNYELQLTIENAFQLYKLKEQNDNLNLKYRKVFTNTTDPIILIDQNYNIVDYNSATITLINSENDNLKSSSFKSLFKHENEVQAVINVISEKEKLQNYECQLLTSTGKKITCLISGNVISSNYGEFTGYQLIIKDITERNKMSQLLLKKIIETQEQERVRISRDLHDGVGQYLAALKLHWESLKSNYDQHLGIESELKSFPIILQETITELRRVCFNTLPLVLNEYGLIRGIKELQLNVSNNDFHIIFNSSSNFPPLTKSLETSVFRIVQEFINNSLKHSGATEVKINLIANQENIVLNLKDNGIGFNINDWEISKGNGLKNIQNRVESVEGKLKINSILNKGTEFDLNFPVQLNE